MRRNSTSKTMEAVDFGFFRFLEIAAVNSCLESFKHTKINSILFHTLKEISEDVYTGRVTRLTSLSVGATLHLLVLRTLLWWVLKLSLRPLSFDLVGCDIFLEVGRNDVVTSC
ncbi:hypothetical protein Droror1_Dr00023513 [Drosera rotundifolia]